MNTLTNSLAHFLWTQTWQLACLGIVLVPVVTLLSKKRPHLAILFCYLLIAKALLPPSISHTKSVFHWVENHAELSTELEHQSVQNERSSGLHTSEGISESINETRELNLGISTEVETTRQAAPIVPSVASSTLKPPLVNRARINQAICILWGIGVVLSGWIIVFRHRKFRQLISSAEPIDSPDLLSRLAGLQADLGIKGNIPLKKIDAMISPAVVGWWKPVILLPSELLKTNSADDLKPIIAHELLHIRRGDLTISLLQCLAQVLWWFHPAVWIVNRRINHLREVCCDGEVLHHVKISNTSYAQALLNVVKQNSEISIPKYISAVRSKEVTTLRLEKLMKTPHYLTYRTPIYGLILALGIAIFALPSAKVISDENEGEQTDTSTIPALESTQPQTNEAEVEKALSGGAQSQLDSNSRSQAPLRRKRTRTITPRPEQIFEVKRENLFTTGSKIIGNVIPRNQIHIRSEADGIVKQVNLTPGRRVNKGDLLLELTNSKLQSALREAELNLDTAYTEMQQSETLREQELLKGTSALQSAELALKVRESEYSRKESLFDRNLISKEDILSFQNNLEQQKQNLSFLAKSRELSERQSEQGQRLKELQLQRFKLARETILQQLVALRILAPMEGIIAPVESKGDILVGAYISAATPIAQLISIDALMVKAGYPASGISDIQVGMACQVNVNGNLHQGTIETIYPTADSNRRVTILFDLVPTPNPAKRIIPGSQAGVYVVTGERPNVLTIQQKFNMPKGAKRLVYRLSSAGKTATAIEVTFGGSGTGRIEIAGPIEEGDRVLVLEGLANRNIRAGEGEIFTIQTR